MIVGVLVGVVVLVAAGVALGIGVLDGFGVKVMVGVIVLVGMGVFVNVGVAGSRAKTQPVENTINIPNTKMRTFFNKESSLCPFNSRITETEYTFES